MAATTNTRRDTLRSGATFELFGSKLTARVAAADTDGAYALLEYDAPPNQPGAPPHLHERTEEYVFVLEGSLSVVLDGEEMTVGPGEGILFSRGVEHSFANRSDDRVRFLTLVRPGGFEQLLATAAARLADGAVDPTPEEFAELIAPYDFVPTGDHAH